MDNIEQLPDKILINGRNIQLDKNKTSLTNVNGNELLFSVDYPICGIISSQDTLIIFSTNETISEIGMYKENGNYETIVIGNFGFSINNPITGIIDYNINGELIVAWTDGNTPIGTLNVDNLPFTLPISKIANDKEINLCKLFPDVIVPDITPINVINGGSLKTGSCQIAITYVLNNGDYVNWVNITNTIPIGNVNPMAKYYYNGNTNHVNDNVFNTSYDAVQETDDDIVSKSIVLNIKNLDSRYNKIKLAAIHKHKNGVFVQEIGNFDYGDKSELEVVYSGQNIGDLSLDEITTNTITYDKCKTLTLVGGKLLLGNITVDTFIDYQPFANNIKVGWKVEELDYDQKVYDDTKSLLCHIDPIVAANMRTLMLDEVYALYVAPIFNDSNIGRAFHIPGREAQLTTEPPFVRTKENSKLNEHNFYLENRFDDARAISENVRYFHAFDTSLKDIYTNDGYNKMGYWENENEFYPNDESFLVKQVDINGNEIIVGDLRGQKVRHHKTPSFDTIYELGDKINKSVYLEFRDIHIPKYMHGKLQGLRFYFAERGSENMTVLGEYPMVMNGFQYDGRTLNDSMLATDDYTTDELLHNLRFNDYFLLTNKPALNANYVKTQYVSNNDLRGLPEYNHYHDMLEDALRNDRNSFADDFRDTFTYNYHTFDRRSNNIISIESIKYAPNDNAATNPSNRGKESTVSIKIPNNKNMLGYMPDYYKEIYIITLNKFLLNAYSNFTNQKLVNSGNILRIEDNKYIYDTFDVKGFDTFINSYRTLMYRGDRSINDPDSLDQGAGKHYGLADRTALFNEFKFTSYSIFNTPYRIDIIVDEFEDKYKNSKFLAKDEEVTRRTNISLDPSIESLPKYYIEYSAVNNIKSIIKYNTSDNFVENIPSRIAKSNVQGKETLNIAWRLFNPLDYYDIVKNKGAIESLKSINKGVMIQTTYSLFKAVVKDVLKTLDTDTYLGTGELFDREPDEVLPTDKGYIGCNSPLTILLDEIGYFVFDVKAKRAFIVNDTSVKDITNDLVKDFFHHVLDNNSDTPVGYNMVAAYDPSQRKLIISNKDGIPFTCNYYNSEELGFISIDDYIPHLFSTTKSNLYSVPDNNKKDVYIHNANNKGTFYGVKHPSKIGVLFNLGEDVVLNDVHIKDLVKLNGKVYRNESINELLIYNQYQSSGNIPIKIFNTINDFDSLRKIGSSWIFNYFRDLVDNPDVDFIDFDRNSIEANINKNKDWFDMSPFISNLVVVQVTFNNLEEKEFILNDISINVDSFKR